ncbi:hypothetical protein Tco_0520896 [Tanacetum coccineum]
MHQEEHLDSDVELDIDDNTIPYHQYQLDSDVQDVPTEEQSLVNDSLRAKLARCKQEMVSLERNKVKHDLDQTIIQRNKRNAELEEKCVDKIGIFTEIRFMVTADELATDNFEFAFAEDLRSNGDREHSRSTVGSFDKQALVSELRKKTEISQFEDAITSV